MKHKLALIAAFAAIPFMVPQEAQARDTCREYTKTIRIGGQVETGYGTACQRPDGAWEIVKLGGDREAQERIEEYIYEDLDKRYRNVRIIYANNYYGHHYNYPRKRYYSSRYYAPRVVYKTPSFGLYFGNTHASNKYYGGHGRKNQAHHGHNGKGKGHKKHR